MRIRALRSRFRGCRCVAHSRAWRTRSPRRSSSSLELPKLEPATPAATCRTVRRRTAARRSAAGRLSGLRSRRRSRRPRADPARRAAGAERARQSPGDRDARRARAPPRRDAAAAVLTGLVVGLGIVGLTWASLRSCEGVQGTSSCGDAGYPLLGLILVAMVVVGALLLRLLRVPDPGSTSFLGVGLAVRARAAVPRRPADGPLDDPGRHPAAVRGDVRRRPLGDADLRRLPAAAT